MINNVLNYIHAFLNLQSLAKLYKQSLDYLNIIYSIAKIKKLEYEELDVFDPSIRGLSIIPKTIIFIDSINKKMALTEYLCRKLLNNFKNKIDQVI